MTGRIYPPAPTIHEATCEDAPPGLLVLSPRAIHDAHPVTFLHTCVSADTARAGRPCVAEPNTRAPHGYVRSSIWPDDATGPLCSICRGSHPESAAAALAAPRTVSA